MSDPQLPAACQFYHATTGDSINCGLTLFYKKPIVFTLSAIIVVIVGIVVWKIASELLIKPARKIIADIVKPEE